METSLRRQILTGKEFQEDNSHALPHKLRSSPLHRNYTGAIPNQSRTANTTVLTLTAFAATVLPRWRPTGSQNSISPPTRR